MNERDLKSLFCSALESGHIKNNDILPCSSSGRIRIRIVEEAYFRSFDLVIAAIYERPIIGENNSPYYNNLLLRTGMLQTFARAEKCRIDCIRFYPVEIKSDQDNIDRRLTNQIINAILTFGLSIVVLDKNHATKLKTGMLNFVPSTIIGYTGFEDCFEVVSTFDRFVSNGIFALNKTSLLKALAPAQDTSKVYRRLVLIQRILQKLTFNQLYYENFKLSNDESKFLMELSGVALPRKADRKRIQDLIKETVNGKITDFM
jgi:hypothetical protein